MKTIVQRTGGRLGNQLYYLLCVYKLNQGCQEPVKYTQVRAPLNPQTDMLELTEELGLENYITSDNSKIDLEMGINNYCSRFGIDYTLEDVESFLSETFLRSRKFAEISEKHRDLKEREDIVAIQVRNGDYLKLPQYLCFNREEYLKKCFVQIPHEVQTAYLFSDDIQKTREDFDGLLRKRFSEIVYVNGNSAVEDLYFSSLFHWKILWNSTFSIWSGFLSNCLFKNYDKMFIPSWYMSGVHPDNINPGWRVIDA